MMPKILIVLGGTSSIANLVVPKLGFDNSKIYYVNRLNINNQLNLKSKKKDTTLIDFGDLQVLEKTLKKFLKQFENEPVVVMNFLGNFGLVESLSRLDVSTALETNKQNLSPFLLIAKLAKNLCSGSIVISFSGAGVGGSNLDDSSLGYLAAKASMSILVEPLDQQLAAHNVRFGLVSPGAFWSPLQKIVAAANTQDIPKSRINRAKQLKNKSSSPEKLIFLLKFLIENPEELGGRSWSANFDSVESKNLSVDFGKMRRLY